MLLKVVSTILRVLSWLVYAVIIAVLLIALPMVGGYRPVVVLSGSMEPSYPVGSIIYYKATGFDDISVGDAITFRLGEGALATHRVVKKNNQDQSFVTKGDNNATQDANPVLYSEVVGRSSGFAVPYAGFVSAYLKNGFILSTLGAILLLSAFVTPEGKKKKTAKKRKVAVGAQETRDLNRSAAKRFVYQRDPKKK